MNFENSQQIVASYNDSSYRSVTNTTINNYITDSFNSHHTGHWRGLVAKRFDGDVTAARAWLAQLGRHAYAQQALAGTCLAHKLALWPHPGQPEAFAAAWRQALAFTLADIEEVQP